MIADRKISYFFVKIKNEYVKITYNIMKKNYNKDFQKLSNWYTVDDVGYRGKMFYLSDLLFHVIGFGWFSCPSLFIGLGRFLWCQHQIYLRYSDILALISFFIISIFDVCRGLFVFVFHAKVTILLLFYDKSHLFLVGWSIFEADLYLLAYFLE